MATATKMQKLSKTFTRFFNSEVWGRKVPIKFLNSSSDPRISTMNDLPSPEGSWQEDYNRKQVKNNSLLFGSLVLTIFTIWIAKDIFPLQFRDPYYPLSKEDFPLNE